MYRYCMYSIFHTFHLYSVRHRGCPDKNNQTRRPARALQWVGQHVRYRYLLTFSKII